MRLEGFEKRGDRRMRSGCATRTVIRKVDLIRRRWSETEEAP